MLYLDITKIKGYSFTGTIDDSLLSDEIMKALGLTRDPNFEKPIKFVGTFTVNWDDDIPLVEIEGISLLGAVEAYKQGPTGKLITYCEVLPKGHPRQGMNICKTDYGKIPIHKTVELKDNEYNYYDLVDDLEHSGDILDWISDRDASLCDYYYDTLMDR